MRPIDADALREEWLESGENEYVYDTNAVLYSIDEAPTIDAAPVRRGEWVNRDYITTAYGHIDCADCTNCGALEVPLDKYDNFCPNCGADMRTEEHHE